MNRTCNPLTTSQKELEFGTDGQRAILGDWRNLKEVSLARLILKVHSSEGFSRGVSDSTRPARCPLEKLTLFKVRLYGSVSDILEGGRGSLTHLSLIEVASVNLKDLCLVLTEHGATLLHLTLASCRLVNTETVPTLMDQEDEFDNWASSGPDWTPGNQARHDAFDRAISACVNLTHLSIEPGSLPIYSPSTLLLGQKKLEVLETNIRNTRAYDRQWWYNLLGLSQVLTEEKRKLKSGCCISALLFLLI